MNSLEDKFLFADISWVKIVEASAEKKIHNAKFSQNARKGDEATLKQLFLQFWPFVDKFPEMVSNNLKYMLTWKRIFEHGPIDMTKLILKARNILHDIERDEMSHRILWLSSCDALGISRTELSAMKPIPEIANIINLLNLKSDSVLLLTRCVGVEIVATSVSKSFLTSGNIKHILNPGGVAWFDAHIGHGTGNIMSHEELTLRLVMALKPVSIETDMLIIAMDQLINAFVAGGEACAQLASRQ